MHNNNNNKNNNNSNNSNNNNNNDKSYLPSYPNFFEHVNPNTYIFLALMFD